MPRITVYDCRDGRSRRRRPSIIGEIATGVLLVAALLAAPGSPSAQQTASPAAAAPPATAPAPATPAVPAGPAATVSGAVTGLPNGATLIVGDQRIRLAGIDPAPPEVLGPIQDWLMHKAGALQCQAVAQTGRYVCRAADGADVAGTMIRNGAARVGMGATAEYRKFEDDARENHRGLWKEP